MGVLDHTPRPSSLPAGSADAAESGRDALAGWWEELFPGCGGRWRMSELAIRNGAEDSPRRFAVRDDRGVPRAIAFVASERSAGQVLRAAEHASGARRLLGAEAGGAVLEPLRAGWIGGVSAAAYPWRREAAASFLGSRWRRPWIRAWAVEWLRSVVRACASRRDLSHDPSECLGSLSALERVEGLDDASRGVVRRAMARLESGGWVPRVVLDHHDLWAGNIMRNQDGLGRPGGPSPYVVIDWAGADLRGAGLSDLVRVARSLRLSPGRLRAEFELHCGVLGIAVEDGVSQMVLGLARMRRNLECFPPDRFLALMQGMLTTAQSAMG